MSPLCRLTVLGVLAGGLAGCQVLASLAEERTLRALAIFVAVAALVGFLFAKMRR